MADTRCANAEYQLDVAVMILEYVAYRAIEAHIAAARWRSFRTVKSKDIGHNSEYKAAKRLLETFHLLVSAFHHNHPSSKLSPSLIFSTKILEFLVLMRTRMIPLFPCTDGVRFSGFMEDSNFSTSMRNTLFQQQLVQTVLRRNWLHLRAVEGSDRDDDLYDSVHTLYHTQFRDESQIPGLYPKLLNSIEMLIIIGLDCSHMLFELIPRFLDLSAEIAGVMGDVSEQWMNLACNLMLQAAIQRFGLLQNSLHYPRATPLNVLDKQAQAISVQLFVEECFAWGLVDTPSRTAMSDLRAIYEHIAPALAIPDDDLLEKSIIGQLETEDSIDNLFTQHTNITATTDMKQGSESQKYSIKSSANTKSNVINADDDDDDDMMELDPQSPPQSTPRSNSDSSISEPNEIPQWSQIRRKALNQVLSLIDWNDISASKTRRLTALQNRYPLRDFFVQLIDYVESMWKTSVGDDISGKPVLVQIEEGSLEGLNADEFEGFLRRVGLKSSVSSDGVHGIRWLVGGE